MFLILSLFKIDICLTVSLSSGHVSLKNGPFSCRLCLVLPEKLGRSSQFSFDSKFEKLPQEVSGAAREKNRAFISSFSAREKSSWVRRSWGGRKVWKEVFYQEVEVTSPPQTHSGDVCPLVRGVNRQQRLFDSSGYYTISHTSERLSTRSLRQWMTWRTPTKSRVLFPLRRRVES